MSTITNLQNRTHKILDNFINDIAHPHFTLADDFGRSELLRRTKTFFDAMDKLSMEEFAKIFTAYNFSSIDINMHEKYQEILNCLVALVIERYSQSDLLRYFFPEDLSAKEKRPEYSSNSSRISHWFQLIGYWFRQLRNKLNYALTPENRDLAGSLDHIKGSLGKKSYTVNNADSEFKMHLGILVKEIGKKALYPSMNSAATTQGEELLEKQERLYLLEADLQLKKQLFESQEEYAVLREKHYQEKVELLAAERNVLEETIKGFETKIQALQEKIASLTDKLNKDKPYISHLENYNSDLEKSIQELGVAPNQDLQNRGPVVEQTHQGNRAAETAITIIENFLEKNPEEENENNTKAQIVNFDNLVAKFKEEYQKFQENRAQLQRHSSQSSDSSTSDTDSNFWATDWDDSDENYDEVDSIQKDPSYFFLPTQKPELLANIRENLSNLQTISKKGIFQIMERSFQEHEPAMEAAATRKSNENQSTSNSKGLLSKLFTFKASKDNEPQPMSGYTNTLKFGSTPKN
jgi:hypothetical protein